MDIVSFVLSMQVFTVIFNTLAGYYMNKIMLDYDYDDPNMKEIIYQEVHKGIISGIKNFFICWIPIYSQLIMAAGIYGILNLDKKTKICDGLTLREGICKKILEDHEKGEKNNA